MIQAIRVIIGTKATESLGEPARPFRTTTHYREEADMAVRTFLKIDKVRGESNDDHHRGWIDLVSWNWLVRGGGGSAAGNGPDWVGFLRFVKTIDHASASLFGAYLQDDPLGNARLEVVSAAGGGA